MPRYRVTVMHGESDTVYSVIDSHAPTADQPAVVRAFRVSIDRQWAKSRAILEADILNAA